MKKYIRLAVVLLVLAAAGATLPHIVSSREDVRDVTLVVRNMTFYLEGGDVPNPSLRLVAGERVRLTLRNEDPGMTHDFNIRDWDVRTKVLEGREEDTITFRVPAPSGSAVAYTCTPHNATMNGAVVVE